MLVVKLSFLVFVSLSLLYASRSIFAVRLHLEPGTKAVIKLGVCPFPNYMQRCVDSKDNCVDDLDCPHEALCCNDGCHRTCSAPRLENVVGYIVLGAALPLNSPATPIETTTIAPSHSNRHSKSLAVSSDSWKLLMGYLCAVSDRLHSTNQFPCMAPCAHDSDCPSHGDQGGIIKCCNNCCLDPAQFIIQHRAKDKNSAVESSTRRYNISQQRTTLRDSSSYLWRQTATPESSKPGMCPPVLVPSAGSLPSGSCERRCGGDRDCYGLEKCCSNGCGFACQRAISFNTVGYGGESLSAPIPAAPTTVNNNNFAKPTRNVFDYSAKETKETTTNWARLNTPMPYTEEQTTVITRPTPMTVLLGSPSYATTDATPNSQRCALPPTSYTECIGISPWRTRYYYHQGLNQCLPIYRCVRSGNNFLDLSSCENACVTSQYW